MRIILHSRSFYVLGALVLIGMAISLLVGAVKKDQVEKVITTVERGEVTELVSVSGVVEAANTAALAFPVSGVVTSVSAREGVSVKKDDLLATLETSRLAAERLDAVGALQKAQADKEELVAGPRAEARNLTDTKIANAKANLDQITKEQDEKVENARRILLSSALIARAVDPNEKATAPVVYGTYTCEEGGSYLIEPYNTSLTRTFTYRVSGPEFGIYNAFFESPGSFGTCGLTLQFTLGDDYKHSEWIIDIPNTKSSVYQSNLNAYELAKKQRDNAIEAAENALRIAEQEATLENAAPRSEALVRANASILQAQARVKAIDAELRDRTIVAPFDGVVTNVDILPGETATTEPVITLLSADAFDLTARIPEIDITKIAEGQLAEVMFDARSAEIIIAEINFISPLATEIDGVAYFEATIEFPDTPTWLRSGLNADIDIVVNRASNVLRLPIRFVIAEENKHFVLIDRDDEPAQKTAVEVGLVGNDGFVEVKGLAEGTVIVAP